MDRIKEVNISIAFIKNPANSREWQALISLSNRALKSKLPQETIEELQAISTSIREDLVESHFLYKEKIVLIKKLILIEAILYAQCPESIDIAAHKYDPYFVAEDVEEVLTSGDISSPRFVGLFDLVNMHASLDHELTPFNEYFEVLTEDLANILNSNGKDEMVQPLEEELKQIPIKVEGPRRASQKRTDVYQLDDLRARGISILDVDVKSLLSTMRGDRVISSTKVFIDLMMDFYQDRVAMFTESSPEYLYHGSKTEERMQYVNAQIDDAVDLLRYWFELLLGKLEKRTKLLQSLLEESATHLQNELEDISNQYGLVSIVTPFDTILNNLVAERGASAEQ
jgi:hypothetical protein